MTKITNIMLSSLFLTVFAVVGMNKPYPQLQLEQPKQKQIIHEGTLMISHTRTQIHDHQIKEPVEYLPKSAAKFALLHNNLKIFHYKLHS